MIHKFIQLLSLNHNLTQLSDENLLVWLETFIKKPNGKSTVIAGIFRELYNQGENNTDEFFSGLTDKSNQLVDNENKIKNKLKTTIIIILIILVIYQIHYYQILVHI